MKIINHSKKRKKKKKKRKKESDSMSQTRVMKEDRCVEERERSQSGESRSVIVQKQRYCLT